MVQPQIFHIPYLACPHTTLTPHPVERERVQSSCDPQEWVLKKKNSFSVTHQISKSVGLYQLYKCQGPTCGFASYEQDLIVG